MSDPNLYIATYGIQNNFVYNASTDLNDIVVGIDLGTTQSLTACFSNGSVNVLQTREGIDSTESFVYCDNLYRKTVGLLARNKAISYHAQNGIYDFKRLIGRTYDDRDVYKSLKFLTYIIQNYSNVPIIIYKHGKQFICKTATEICTIFLTKLNYDVRHRLQLKGTNKTKAVVTVPTYFTIRQRKATLEAAEAAGFKVLQLLNEPTAAALFYFLNHTSETNQYFLVYDLGGGTFDVSILKKTSTNIETVGVSGDMFLGGRDFDNIILSYVIQVIEKNYHFDPRKLTNMLLQLTFKCEQAKINLSFTQNCTITMERFCPLMQVEITRQQFEHMAINMFTKTLHIVKLCIENCGLTKHNIAKVILSGGSTKIPKIKEMLADHFGVDKLYNFVQPDTCVVKGAAIQAAMLSRHTAQYISMTRISDGTPLSNGTYFLPKL